MCQQANSQPRQSDQAVYWFAGIDWHHGRLVAKFYADTLFGRDVRRIALEAGALWAPQDETEEPVADPVIHAELIARAHEELARSRSVVAVAAHDRGQHLHVRPRRWAT